MIRHALLVGKGLNELNVHTYLNSRPDGEVWERGHPPGRTKPLEMHVLKFTSSLYR